MSLRFRRSARLGPLRFHFTRNGLSSISIGGRGVSYNVPVHRRGGARTTLGLPGTGLSWSWENGEPGAAEGLPNSRRLRAGQLQALQQSLLAMLNERLFSAGGEGQRMWEGQRLSRLLSTLSPGSRQAALLAVIESPEAMNRYLQAARSQDEAKRRAHRCIEAVQTANRLLAAQGWND
jgi:hypothetical protein